MLKCGDWGAVARVPRSQLGIRRSFCSAETVTRCLVCARIGKRRCVRKYQTVILGVKECCGKGGEVEGEKSMFNVEVRC